MNWAATRHVIRFLAVVYITVLVLAVVNLLPQFLGGEPRGVVRYLTPDAVRAAYGISPWQPASLPRTWDTAQRRLRVAVGRPDWVQTAFPGSGTSTLSLCESLEPAFEGANVPDVLLPPGEVLQSEDMNVAGRTMRARRLLLQDGAVVHELWWRSGGRNVMLRHHGPMEELVRIVQQAMGAGR